MLNPDCTPGWTTVDDDGLVTGHCGCGWSEPFGSKSRAKDAQREHRFPPRDVDLGSASTEEILAAQAAYAAGGFD